MAQSVNGVGLLGGQSPSGRFPSYRVGHVSGHYYNVIGAATMRAVCAGPALRDDCYGWR